MVIYVPISNDANPAVKRDDEALRDQKPDIIRPRAAQSGDTFGTGTKPIVIRSTTERKIQALTTRRHFQKFVRVNDGKGKHSPVSHALHRPPVASRPLERRSLRRPEQTQDYRCIRSLQAREKHPARQSPRRQQRNVNQNPKADRHERKAGSPTPPASAGQAGLVSFQEMSAAPRAGRPLPAMQQPKAHQTRHFPAPRYTSAG